MIELNKNTMDYLEGKITAKEFKDKINECPEIIAEIESLIPAEAEMTGVDWGYFKHYNCDLKKTIDVFTLSTPFGKSYIFKLIKLIVSKYTNDIVFTTRYSEEFDFYIDALPDYVGGYEVDEFINAIYESVKNINNKKEQIKQFKAAIKDSFVFDTKRPVWKQSPEWLMGSENKPMKYLFRTQDGSKFTYVFEDIITHERRTVDQYT